MSSCLGNSSIRDEADAAYIRLHEGILRGSAGLQVEAADLAAQSAAVTVLKALPELQLMLKDFGSANRDG